MKIFEVTKSIVEGYKLQLERDTDMMVLNITDTATGKRTEVRGKPGYETNYDPNDKLHQLLDRVGKSANISELMNGEVVSINPKHPDATKAKAATDVAYNEEFDNISDIDLNNALDTMAKTAVNGERLKDVFIMRHQHNMTFKQIGNEIGTGIDRARQVYLRSLRYLRKILQDYNVEENFADGKNQIKEALDNPYPFKLSGPSDSQSFVATAQTPNGVLRMDIETTDYDNFGIDFAVGKSMGKTEAGDEFRVFATVVAMMKKWINTVGIEHVESFDFGANKDEHASDGRAKLYARFAKQLASKLGWRLEQSTTANNSTAFFKLTNPKPVPRDDEYWDALEENFADGKKKGKSRPGRVKRSGASCNGSVTDLRKRAKNASGEKAKMYHWCANMKSGRKKK